MLISRDNQVSCFCGSGFFDPNISFVLSNMKKKKNLLGQNLLPTVGARIPAGAPGGKTPKGFIGGAAHKHNHTRSAKNASGKRRKRAARQRWDVFQ